MRQLTALIVMASLLFGAPASAGSYYEDEDDTVLCESYDQEETWCDADTRYGVELVDQNSRAPCIEDETWGYTRRGIWVSDGCRGEFALGGEREYDEDTIICESVNRRRQYCPVRIRYGAELVEQFSSADCEEDETWGYDRGGIWVSDGCRGAFSVE